MFLLVTVFSFENIVSIGHASIFIQSVGQFDLIETQGTTIKPMLPKILGNLEGHNGKAKSEKDGGGVGRRRVGVEQQEVDDEQRKRELAKETVSN